MTKNLSTDVCIVGGGPAGMLLGVLLADKGIQVTVLESHPDFEREYRGEVLMPRFTQMMKQIGLADFLEKYPNLKLKNFEFFLKNKRILNINLANLVAEAPFATWMPQPVMLNALWDKARTYSNFQILFGQTVRNVIYEDKKIVGVAAEHKGEPLEVRAKVTVGADGRWSSVRKTAGFEFESEKYDFDLMWFTMDQPPGYENTVRAFFSTTYRCLMLPKYPKHIQCGLVIPKDSFAKIRAKGLEALRQDLIECHPLLVDFAKSIKDFSPFSILQARASFVRKWAQDGCLLIGDAAHTCSPAGAIGVSVAAGTAIVAADVLIKAFKANDFSEQRLSEVQKLREADVKKIQRMQAGFTNAFFLRYPSLQELGLMVIRVIAKTGLFQILQRELFIMKEPLPIDPAIKLRS